MSRKANPPREDANFNELNNWLEIMDVDPPHTAEDKKAMHERLNEIFEDLLAEEDLGAGLASYKHVDKKALHREMVAIINR